MTKAELVTKVAKEANLTKAAAEKAVEDAARQDRIVEGRQQ